MCINNKKIFDAHYLKSSFFFKVLTFNVFYKVLKSSLLLTLILCLHGCKTIEKVKTLVPNKARYFIVIDTKNQNKSINQTQNNKFEVDIFLLSRTLFFNQNDQLNKARLNCNSTKDKKYNVISRYQFFVDDNDLLQDEIFISRNVQLINIFIKMKNFVLAEKLLRVSSLKTQEIKIRILGKMLFIETI